MKSKEAANKILFSLITLTLVLSFINIASAGISDDIAGGIKSLVEGIQKGGDPVFRALFGSTALGDEFAIQILSFILVTLVIYGILSTTNIFGSKPWINITIGIVVSVIGIRFIPDGFLQAMAIPSSAFVAGMVLVVPLIVASMVILKLENLLVRRALFAIYGALIVILWFYNLENDQIGFIRWVYPAVAVACLVAFAFDGTLHRLFGKARAQRTIESSTNIQRDRIVSELRDLRGALAEATTDSERQRIRAEIKDKTENLRDL